MDGCKLLGRAREGVRVLGKAPNHDDQSLVPIKPKQEAEEGGMHKDRRGSKGEDIPQLSFASLGPFELA